MKLQTARAITLAAFIAVWLVAILMDVAIIGDQMRLLGRTTPGFRISDSMRITSLQSQTSLVRPNQDVVLKVDGQDVRNPWGLQEIVDASLSGDPHDYLLHRSGGEATASVFSRSWEFTDALGEILWPLLIGFLHVIVACLAFWKARQHDAVRPLLVYCGAMVALVAAPSLPLKESFAPDPWIIGLLLLPVAAVIHLTTIYPAPWRGMKEKGYLRLLPYGVAIIYGAVILASYPLIRWKGNTGIELFSRFTGGIAWLAVLLTCAWLANHLFETSRRSAAPGARVLARLSLEGATISFLPAFMLFVLQRIWPHPALQGIFGMSLVLLPVFPLTVVAGLSRFKPNEVQRNVEFCAIGVLSGAALILVYAPGVAVLSAISAALGWDDESARMVGTISAVVLCPLVINWTKRLLDWVFERRRADFGQVVGEFAQAIRNLLTSEDLIQAFVARAEQAFQPRYIVVFGLEDDMLVAKTVLGLSADRVRPLKGGDSSLPKYIGAFALRGVEPASKGEKQLKGLAIALRPATDEVPLWVVVIGPRRTGEGFAPDDTELTALLGDQLQVGLEHVRLVRQVADQEKLRHEMEIARTVQLGLLPKKLPVVDGIEVTGSSEPALEVGGDLYDVVALEGGRMGILIGDVSGKGMPAALLMTTALSCFRTAVQRYDSPAAMLTRMNEIICGNKPVEGMFVAVCYAIWEPAGRLVIANGGMPRPLQNGVEIMAKGPPLGMIVGHQYREMEVDAPAGDSILFFSDGLEDVHDTHGKNFGIERIIDLAKLGAPTAAALSATMLEAVSTFGAGAAPFDDITMVTVRTRKLGMLEAVVPAAAPATPAAYSTD